MLFETATKPLLIFLLILEVIGRFPTAYKYLMQIEIFKSISDDNVYTGVSQLNNKEDFFTFS